RAVLVETVPIAVTHLDGEAVVVVIAVLRDESAARDLFHAFEARHDVRVAGALDLPIEELEKRARAREDRVVLAEEAGPHADTGKVILAVALDEERSARVASAGVGPWCTAVRLQEVVADLGNEDARIGIVGVVVGLRGRTEQAHRGAALDARPFDLSDVSRQGPLSAPAHDRALTRRVRHALAEDRDRRKRELTIEKQDRHVRVV